MTQRLHICHIISGDLWAGAEVQAYTLLKALQEQNTFNLSAIILNEGKLSEKLEELGITTTLIPESSNSFIKIYQTIKKQFSKNPPSILHSHRYKENILAGLLKKPCGIKALVQTIHGTHENLKGLKKIKMNLNMSINRYFTNRFFNAQIAVSSEIEQYLKRKFRYSNTVTIHNAIDVKSCASQISQENMRQNLSVPPDAFVIGGVGRLVPVKGFEILIEAVALLKTKIENIHLIIVGDGPLKNDLQECCKRTGLENEVTFTGFRDDVADVVKALDIFVVSSHHEGIPMAVLEAMAQNKAVVSTKVGGMNEIIEDSVSGILIPPNDPRSISDAIIELHSSPQNLNKLEKEAAKRINQKFSLTHLTSKMSDLYSSLK